MAENYQFTEAQRTAIRRFMGYPPLGPDSGTILFGALVNAPGVLEYRPPVAVAMGSSTTTSRPYRRFQATRLEGTWHQRDAGDARVLYRCGCIPPTDRMRT